MNTKLLLGLLSGILVIAGNNVSYSNDMNNNEDDFDPYSMVRETRNAIKREALNKATENMKENVKYRIHGMKNDLLDAKNKLKEVNPKDQRISNPVSNIDRLRYDVEKILDIGNKNRDFIFNKNVNTNPDRLDLFYATRSSISNLMYIIDRLRSSSIKFEPWDSVNVHYTTVVLNLVKIMKDILEDCGIDPKTGRILQN